MKSRLALNNKMKAIKDEPPEVKFRDQKFVNRFGAFFDNFMSGNPNVPRAANSGGARVAPPCCPTWSSRWSQLARVSLASWPDQIGTRLQICEGLRTHLLTVVEIVVDGASKMVNFCTTRLSAFALERVQRMLPLPTQHYQRSSHVPTFIRENGSKHNTLRIACWMYPCESIRMGVVILPV